MKEKILRDITVESFFISIGEFDRLMTSETDVHLALWRALRTDEESSNSLYPDFERREIRIGHFREPDLKLETMGSKSYATPYVSQKFAGDMWKAHGTSLFDRPNVFKGKKWEYFEIPEGTLIPKGLVIVRDDRNERFEATHYTISPSYRMPVENFLKLLDQLALNASQAREVV